MNCLLYCSEILGVLLFIPWSAYAEGSTFSYQGQNSSEFYNSSEASSVISYEPSPSTVSMMSPKKTENLSSVSPTRQLIQTTTSPLLQFLKKECLNVMLVCVGLIIICTSLLITTLLLTWKVCQLHRRLKMKSTEFWMETDKKNQSGPETEAKETTVLMADSSQTNQEMKNGSAKDDGGKVNGDGQTGEEKEDEEETPNTEEASASVESSSPSKPQEEAGSPQPTAAAAASSSEVTEEPKDVP